MKVALWPPDQGGCGFYRLMAPGKALLEQGADVWIDTAGPRIIWDRPWTGAQPSPTHRVMGCEPYPADVVVLGRPGRRWWADVIPYLKEQGIRIVVDVDDLFDGIEKRHVAFREFAGPITHHRFIDKCCKLADVVTVTTPALARRYGHGKAVVLPNLVPESYLSLDVAKLPKSVGWSGLVCQHPGDLRTTEGVIPGLLQRHEWLFRVVGPRDGVRADLRLSEEPSASGSVPVREYPSELGRLELGIVPLAENRFNEAKSCLKGSEMASLGVPVVMSPTPDNVRLHQRGVGLLADSRGKWRRHLDRLMGSAEMRADLAGRGREVMATQTIERHCGRWLDAWTGRAEARAA